MHSLNAPRDPETEESFQEFLYKLESRQEELDRLTIEIEELAEKLCWPAEILLHVQLVLEELIVNTIHYAFPDGRNGHIEVLLRFEPESLYLKVSDDGDAFDPFSIADPDLSLDLEERPIGGLGVHFIRTYMDHHEYIHRDGLNQVILIKKLRDPRAKKQ
jgi:anti-sigma regulatory factor (Ser/Thr protein kinase)